MKIHDKNIKMTCDMRYINIYKRAFDWYFTKNEKKIQVTLLEYIKNKYKLEEQYQNFI